MLCGDTKMYKNNVPPLEKLDCKASIEPKYVTTYKAGKVR